MGAWWGGRKGQAKLPMRKIYVKISCGLEPGTERRDPHLGSS